MPLVGGIEIRERLQRYPGEPRYKRLDFVRPKSKHLTDEWRLVHSSRPGHAPQYWNGNQWLQQPQGPYYPPYSQIQPRMPPQYLQQQPYMQQPMPANFQQPGLGVQFSGHPMQQPQPHYQHIQPRLEGPRPQQPRLDSRPFNPGAVGHFGRVYHSDDEDIVEIIEPGRPRSNTRLASQTRFARRANSISRWPTGDSLYSTDSEDDERGRRGHSRNRERSRSRRSHRGW